MVVEYSDLTREKFSQMSHRETVTGLPVDYADGTLTKTQILVCFMVADQPTSGFGQIRHYYGKPLSNGVYIPSESVPETLDEKGWLDVGRKRNVSRRTGRTSSGFEKKKEGGHVSLVKRDALDDIAQKLGFDRARSDDALEWAREQLKDHPNAKSQSTGL